MRKNKKIYVGFILVIMISLFTLSLASCNNETATLQRVVMLGNFDGDIFHSSVESVDLVEKKYQDEDADKTKSIVLANGKHEDVLYVQSKKDELSDIAIYSSENENISCYYDSKSDLLIQICAENDTIPIPNHITTESEYRDWAEQLLTVYGVEDLSSYRYSCQTNVVVSNEKSAYQDQYMYFYTDVKSNERISQRHFTYTKYFGEYPTTDTIIISVFPLTGSVIIKFDDHNFADLTEVTFDESTIVATIHSYIANSINKEKYAFVSMNIIHKTLTCIETEVCLRVGVEIKLLPRNEKKPLTVLVPLIVYLE